MAEQWFSIRTISQIALQLRVGTIPISVKGLLTMAARDSWESRRRAGRGGGREFHIDSLPELVRTALNLNLDRPAAGRPVHFNIENSLSDAAVPLTALRDSRAVGDDTRFCPPLPVSESAAASGIPSCWQRGDQTGDGPSPAETRGAEARAPGDLRVPAANSILSDAAVPATFPTPCDWRADGYGVAISPTPAAASDISFENSLSGAAVPHSPVGNGAANRLPPFPASKPATASDISPYISSKAAVPSATTTPRDWRADGDGESTKPEPAAASEKEIQRKLIWQSFERATEKNQRVATRRAGVTRAVADRAEAVGWTWAYKEVAAENGLPVPTVRRWSEACRAFDRADYPAVLVDGRKQGRPRDASYDERIWDWFYADYGRNEEPAAMAVWRRVAALAARENLQMPHLATLVRRFRKLPRKAQLLLRKGPRAVAAMYPHQTRSVAHFDAMEACNADGHIFDVFVKFPDGEVGRPILAAIQDMRSRMIVAHRLGKTESGDLVRMTYFDAIEKFGVFKNVYIDNGRAWMTKEMTAGMPHRYRFRRRDAREDFMGVLTLLDITPHATTPFHGQSKPIERAFGDFCTEKIARHPLCAGAYTGNTPTAKPENYGSKAVPFAEFSALVDQQIALHNRQPNRRTEICRGILSFEQAFMESWNQTVPRMLAPSQKFLFLLKSEPITVRKPVGEIELFGNRFTSACVAELAGQKVIARFDPQHIQRGIRVYRLDGSFVGEAECIDPVGYDNLEAAREHNRNRRAFVKSARDYSEAEARITDAEFRRMNSVTPEAPLRPRPTTTRMIPDAPRVERELPKANMESIKRRQRISAQAKVENEERRRSGAA
jgi:putative transposase